MRAGVLCARVACVLVVVLLGGCNLERFTTNTTAPVLANGAVALDQESDLEFARDALPASLKTLETFLVSSPDNPELLFLLTRGFNSYAFAFLERDLERAQLTGPQERIDALTRRSVLHYLRARAYGFRLLEYPELEAAALDGHVAELKWRLAELTVEDVPALFWLTQAWAAAINLAQDDPDMVGALPVVEALLERILELDRGYMKGMPLAVYGTYHASRPPMFGGDPEKARAAFEEAVRDYGDENLLVCYLYGRFYGAQTQDRAVFNKMMAKVLDADVEKIPALRLNNEVARDRARFWVTRADELFFE
jgi:hypothetical protein